MSSKMQGTCGACFRRMSLNADGTVVRHGWQERGGRQVGSYGNVHHEGACFGVGWAPYEVSSACTEAFLERVLFRMGVAAQEWIAHLSTRPTMLFTGKTWVSRDVYAHWQVRLVDGAPMTYATEFSVYTQTYHEDRMKRIPAYVVHHAAETAQAEARWNGIARDALYCVKMITEWAPSAPVAVEKKAPLTHRPNVRGNGPACRFSARGQLFRMAEAGAAPTCSKCAAAPAR